MDFDVHRHCDNCWDCDRELASMVNGLIELQAELAKSQAGPRDTASAISHQAPVSPPIIGRDHIVAELILTL